MFVGLYIGLQLLIIPSSVYLPCGVRKKKSVVSQPPPSWGCRTFRLQMVNLKRGELTPQLGISWAPIPSGYVKIAIENDHRNSGFSH